MSTRNPFDARQISCDDPPTEFLELSAEKQIALIRWATSKFQPSKRENPDSNSYSLKHRFEYGERGFYVTNGEMKGAMMRCGFMPVRTSEQNWTFRIQSAVGCPYALHGKYNFKSRCWHPVNIREGMCTYHYWRKRSGVKVEIYDERLPCETEAAT